MRIAILTPFFFHKVSEIHGEDRIVWGGAERYQIELCRLIRSMGHEVTIIQALPQPPKGVQPRVVHKEHDGVQITCIPLNSGSWTYGTSAELNMVFNEHAGLADIRIYFTTFMAFPHVVHPAITISHGIWWDHPSSEYSQLPEEERREWYRRNLYGFTAPDVCVSVDSNVRRVIQAIRPGAEDRTTVIPNFVDTKAFTPKPKEFEGKVLYPRRLTILRGSNDFIKASRDYPQYQYHGCGQAADAGIETQVKAWADTTPHVKFIWRPMDEMPQVYQDADIAVVPTKAAEGMSLSLLEAMATGLPVITTPVGGLMDPVIPGYNALVYDPNHENLGEYIHQMAKDADMRERFSRRNREIAVECFDISIWRKRWADLLAAFA